MSMSPLSAKLVQFEEQYHATWAGPFVALGFSCILHAKAVYTGVEVLADLVFSHLKTEQRRQKRQECAADYCASFKLLNAALDASVPRFRSEETASTVDTPRSTENSSAESEKSWVKVARPDSPNPDSPNKVPSLTPWPPGRPFQRPEGSTPSTTPRHPSEEWEEVTAPLPEGP